jgi:lysylphosphatidylglycerol synthetase-like protein (DUF2156 family)
MRVDMDKLVAGVLGVLGAYLVLISIWMLVAPGSFFDAIGPFGERNDHYIRDAATFQLALGVLALVAVRRPELRWVAVGVIGLEFVLHAVNHLVDIDETSPAWVGPFDFVGLALASIALVWIFLMLRRERR